MITFMQPRTIEIICSNGVIGYPFELPDGHWEIRYCTLPFRGDERQELPEILRGAFGSAEEACRFICGHYRTTVRAFRMWPLPVPACMA
jgi:hypothetical protein